MLSNRDIDAMSYNELMTHASELHGLIDRSYADTVGMDHAESEAYVESTVGAARRALRIVNQRLLRVGQPQTVDVRDYNTSAHCPKCFRGVSVSIAMDEWWLFGATKGWKIINLYCRQCKGIRWRK